MYSEEFDNNMSYNDEQYVDYDYQQEEQKPSFWNENKGLIIKIIIIILCVLILIWLILKIKGNNSSSANNENSMAVYNSNVDTMRLALEKYFFIDGNMPNDGETGVVTLSDLNNKGYIGEVVDANKKSCDINKSVGTLVKGTDSYILTINLTCGNMTGPKVYNYSLETNSCLNCTGFTYMDGTNNGDDVDNNENNDQVVDEQTKLEESLSCKVWSDWTSIKLDDDSLDVRTRVLIKGIRKAGIKELITYSDWSEYTTNVITPSETLEVEMVVKTEEVWESKTSDKEVVAGSTIRNVNKNKTSNGSYSYCPSGYEKDKVNKKCVKYSDIKTGDLTYVQYNTYKVINKPCDGPFVVNGKTIIKNCQYQTKETIDLKWGTSYTTTYTYEELTKKEVTYYRSRTKTVETVEEQEDVTDYIEESKLPEGYEKLEGSEKTEYSYKIKVCEK